MLATGRTSEATEARPGLGSLLLVEDDALVARAITCACAPLARVLHANTEAAAVRFIRTDRTICAALIDVKLGADERAGLRVLDVFARARPNAPRAVITGYHLPQLSCCAFEHRALFLAKPFDERAIAAIRNLAVAAAAQGASAEARPARDAAATSQLDRWGLCGRQRRIAELAAGGANRDEIARALNMPLNTVKVHVRRLLGRIGLPHLTALRAELLRAAATRTVDVQTARK